jgi:hypothetical protein
VLSTNTKITEANLFTGQFGRILVADLGPNWLNILEFETLVRRASLVLDPHDDHHLLSLSAARSRQGSAPNAKAAGPEFLYLQLDWPSAIANCDGDSVWLPLSGQNLGRHHSA